MALAASSQGAAHYRHNSGDVNKAIAALLWRIASPTGLDLEALMYQVRSSLGAGAGAGHGEARATS